MTSATRPDYPVGKI